MALAVVAIHGLPGCDEARRQVLAEAAAAAQRIFTAGESVVVLESGRVLVLAERQPLPRPSATRHLAQAIEDAISTGRASRSGTGSSRSHRTATHLADHLRLLAPPDRPLRSEAGPAHGGWVTSNVVGPFTGGPGSQGW